METRIAKKSRFQIVKLEERVAPAAVSVALGAANASGTFYAASGTATSASAVSFPFFGINYAAASSASAATAD
jgi:hypothetical protein